MKTESLGVDLRYMGKTVGKGLVQGRKCGLSAELCSALIRYYVLKRSFLIFLSKQFGENYGHLNK